MRPTGADPAKDAAQVRFPPPAIPLLTILAGVLLDYLWPIDVGVTVPALARYWLGGLVVVGSILGLGVWPILMFRRTGQSVNPWKPTPEIVERGPFRITRNPMYLQMVLVCLGFALILVSVWILVLTPACAWLLSKLAIEPEEAYLERKFGAAYRAYTSRVRRWL